jgi:hypothetical protein
MSWWDAKGLTSLATQALKTAQKKIDKVLDIKEEDEEPSDACIGDFVCFIEWQFSYTRCHHVTLDVQIAKHIRMGVSICGFLKPVNLLRAVIRKVVLFGDNGSTIHNCESRSYKQGKIILTYKNATNIAQEMQFLCCTLNAVRIQK